MRRGALLAVPALALAACASPAPVQPAVGVGLSPSGVRVVPRVAADFGGAALGLGLDGGSVGTRVGGVGLGFGF